MSLAVVVRCCVVVVGVKHGRVCGVVKSTFVWPFVRVQLLRRLIVVALWGFCGAKCTFEDVCDVWFKEYK